MFDLVFPGNYKSYRYSDIHYRFFLEYARIAKASISYDNTGKVFGHKKDLVFSVLINGKQVVIDYADHSTRNYKKIYRCDNYFKFQTTETSNNNSIPLGPPMIFGFGSGYSIEDYLTLRKTFIYAPSDKICYKQTPNGNATIRRTNVYNLLKSSPLLLVDYDITSNQSIFWKSHKDAKASICVPGATEYMIDRGQMELFGLGVCTIAPNLTTVLAYDKRPVPGVHYIQCKDDYSNLISICENLDSVTAKRIGTNARTLFDEVYTPVKYFEWILKNIT